MFFLKKIKSFIRCRILGKRDNRAFMRSVSKKICINLINRFPELKILGFKVSEDNSRELLKFYRQYLPSFYPPAQGAHLRNLLLQLSETTQDSDLKKKVEIEIAKSNLDEGIPELAKILYKDESFKETVQNEITKSDEA